jgi:hypothetical protein
MLGLRPPELKGWQPLAVEYTVLDRPRSLYQGLFHQDSHSESDSVNISQLKTVSQGAMASGYLSRVQCKPCQGSTVVIVTLRYVNTQCLIVVRQRCRMLAYAAVVMYNQIKLHGHQTICKILCGTK